MNKIKAQIASIQSAGDLLLVRLRSEGIDFSSLIINNNESYICQDNFVYMVFKETEVSIGKNMQGEISIRNRFPSTITSIKRGELLSEVVLDFKNHLITSVITKASADSLQLTIGDTVEGLLKTNELLLMKYE